MIERRFGKLLATLAIAIMGAVLMSMPAHAQGSHTRTTFTEDFDFVVSASESCTGEDVHIFGALDGIVQTTTTPRRQIVVISHFTPHLTAIGLSSGLEDIAVGPLQIATIDGTAPTVTATVNIIQLIAPGSSDNLTITETLHVTVNANGTTTVSFDDLRGGCRG